ncbi:hypothetical protein F0562_022965 [Nyssa sinensis]|uniref:Late embryogenesis abundant protein LEA-2 subgroup domain-containing protein n=1 Tax=Nyssa sinensis TaxID=561372 RepID=A0A5J5BF89_9ASTE|nr:hypothetical protein F0562_022965 [Nyssa sinensis]
MASPKADEPANYCPLPDPDPHHEQSYIVLPTYFPAVLRLQRRFRLICTATLFLFTLAVAVYSLWPSVPDINIVRLRLNRIHIHTFPRIAIDITLNLTVEVRNRDLYLLDYRSLDVAIGYREKQLGFVTSDHGIVRARRSSYVHATIELVGVEVFSDVIFLLEDLAKGSVPFDTVTEVRDATKQLSVKIVTPEVIPEERKIIGTSYLGLGPCRPAHSYSA